MEITELSDFLLVGGPALALHYGHRISVDLDLFSSTKFETDNFLPQIFSFNRGSFAAQGFYWVSEGRTDGLNTDRQ